MQVALNTVSLVERLQKAGTHEKDVLQFLRQHRVDWQKRLCYRDDYRAPLLWFFAMQPTLCTVNVLDFIFRCTDARQAIETQAIGRLSISPNNTALMWAAGYNNPAMIHALVKHGADVTLVTSQRCNLLHMCFVNKSVAALQALIELKVHERLDLNAVTDEGLTILHLLAQHSHAWQVVPTLRLLLGSLPIEDFQLNPTVVCKAGYTPADMVRLHQKDSALEIDTFINYMDCLETQWLERPGKVHRLVHDRLHKLFPSELRQLVVVYL